MKDFPNLIFDFHHNSAMCSMPPSSLRICRCILNPDVWQEQGDSGNIALWLYVHMTLTAVQNCDLISQKKTFPSMADWFLVTCNL